LNNKLTKLDEEYKNLEKLIKTYEEGEYEYIEALNN